MATVAWGSQRHGAGFLQFCCWCCCWCWCCCCCCWGLLLFQMSCLLQLHFSVADTFWCTVDLIYLAWFIGSQIWIQNDTHIRILKNNRTKLNHAIFCVPTALNSPQPPRLSSPNRPFRPHRWHLLVLPLAPKVPVVPALELLLLLPVSSKVTRSRMGHFSSCVSCVCLDYPEMSKTKSSGWSLRWSMDRILYYQWAKFGLWTSWD